MGLFAAQLPALLMLVGMALAVWCIGRIHQIGPYRENDQLIHTMGIRKEKLSKTRTAFRSLYMTSQWALEGYVNYIQNRMPYIMPSIDRGPVLIVPTSQIKRLYHVPENRVDMRKTANDSLQAHYTIRDQYIVENILHFDVIRNQITRNLEALTAPIATELAYGFEKVWGLEPDWKTIKLWPSCLNLIGRAANGAFCGAPLCRDEKFLACLQRHAMSIFGGAILINSTPRVLKHITGVLVRWACSYFCRGALQISMPIVRGRVENTLRMKANASCEWNPPQDALQWMIEEAICRNNPEELDTRRIAERLLFTNDVSMHTTSFTMQNFILNLFSSDPSLGYVETLRNECEQVILKAKGVWSREAVQQLRLVDSAIRESMRVSPFSVFGLPRTIVDTDGVDIGCGDSTINIPVNTIIALPVEHTHLDEKHYPNARSFDPFRFVQSDATIALGKQSQSESQSQPTGGKSAVALDDHFLGFGAGRFACPGRFFALHEMKLMVAHMLLHYDVDHIPNRTAPRDIIWLKAPNANATIRVRRRLTTVQKAGLDVQ
ncbi:cytochrome P450 [Xylaria telfairii]|nr:cytochrome P450 [Xylaria telfairii]